MKENSIKKDIEKVENLIKRCEECKLKECINCETSYTEIMSIKRIVDSYKKVLKENEELKEYNMTYKKILGLADNRIYRKKYLEERRKEQPNLLYPRQ